MQLKSYKEVEPNLFYKAEHGIAYWISKNLSSYKVDVYDIKDKIKLIKSYTCLNITEIP